MSIEQIKEYLKQVNKTILDLPGTELKQLHGELCTITIDGVKHKGFLNTLSVLNKGKLYMVLETASYIFHEINHSNINQFKLK